MRPTKRQRLIALDQRVAALEQQRQQQQSENDPTQAPALYAWCSEQGLTVPEPHPGELIDGYIVRLPHDALAALVALGDAQGLL